MSYVNVMGRRITPLQRRVCGKAAEEALHVAESAEECVTAVQLLVKARQITVNPISPEVTKISRVIKFLYICSFHSFN